MRLTLTLRRTETESVDVAVTLDPEVTVGVLAEHLHSRDAGRLGPAFVGPVTLAIRDESGALSTLAADQTVARSALVSGARIAVVPGRGDPRQVGETGARLHVLSGPMHGLEVSLGLGTHTIGRHPSCDVQLLDSRVSGRHARLLIDSVIEIIDDGSSNGLKVAGVRVERAILGPADEITLGGTTLSVTRAAPPAGGRNAIAVDRPPRLDPPYRGGSFVAPAPPVATRGWRLPVLVVATPAVAGAIYFAVAQSTVAAVLIALSPVLLLASFLEARVIGRLSQARVRDGYLAQVAEFDIVLREAADAERRRRQGEHPGPAELLDAARRRTELLWARRPEQPSFLELRLGLGAQPSRNAIALPSQPLAAGAGQLGRALTDLAARHGTVDDVPVVARPRAHGGIGVAGPESAIGVARALILQLAILHSPADLVIAAIVAPTQVAEWAWLKWLPHTSAPAAASSLAGTVADGEALLARLSDLVASPAQPGRLPAVVVLVDDAAPVDRARLVELAEQGGARSVHVVWLAQVVTRLPAACRTFVEVSQVGPDSAGFVHVGERVAPLNLEPVDRTTAEQVARLLSPLVDSGVRAEPPRTGHEPHIVDLPFAPGAAWPARSASASPVGQPQS